MGVLICSAWPGAGRIGKEHLDGAALSPTRMFGPLVAPRIGQGFSPRGRSMPECLREALGGIRGIRPVHAGQDDQACRPLHQRANGRAIAGTRDQITFPVARDGATGHVDPHPACEGGAPCAPDAVRSAVRAAGHRAATHAAPHRSFLSRAVSPCRQDTHVGDVPQSARASSLGPGRSGHTVSATGPRVCGAVWADAPGPPPDTVPCRPDTAESRVCCAYVLGSRCWARSPTLWPSLATKSLEPGPRSGFHVLRHSYAYSHVWTWQHRSPTGCVVLHLELELKPLFSVEVGFGAPPSLSSNSTLQSIRSNQAGCMCLVWRR